MLISRSSWAILQQYPELMEEVLEMDREKSSLRSELRDQEQRNRDLEAETNEQDKLILAAEREHEDLREVIEALETEVGELQDRIDQSVKMRMATEWKNKYEKAQSRVELLERIANERQADYLKMLDEASKIRANSKWEGRDGSYWYARAKELERANQSWKSNYAASEKYLAQKQDVMDRQATRIGVLQTEVMELRKGPFLWDGHDGDFWHTKAKMIECEKTLWKKKYQDMVSSRDHWQGLAWDDELAAPVLKKQIAELKAEADDLRSLATRKCQENDRLRNEVGPGLLTDSWEKDASILRSTARNLREGLDAALAREADGQKYVKQLQERIATLRKEKEASDFRAGVHQTDFERTVGQLDNARRDIGQLHGKVQRLNQEFNQVSETLGPWAKSAAPKLKEAADMLSDRGCIHGLRHIAEFVQKISDGWTVPCEKYPWSNK